MNIRRRIGEAYRFYESIDHQRQGINKEIFYVNWWGSNKIQWFNEFFISRGVLKTDVPRQMTMTSVMGPRWINKLPMPEPVVFFTAEDTEFRYQEFDDYLLDCTALSLGFKEITDIKNYIRFPLWLIYYLSPDGTTRNGTDSDPASYSIQDFISVLNSNSTFSSRPIGASLIARHDSRGNGSGLRKTAMNLVQGLIPVESAGSIYHNTDILHEKYSNKIDNYLRDCQFNICLENPNSAGYVTEKLFQSLVNGCIPIYWGSNNKPEPEILTGNGIVFFDPEKPFLAQQQIQRLLDDPGYREDFLSRPKTTPRAAEIINEKLHALSTAVAGLM